MAVGCGDDPVVGGDARPDTPADQMVPTDKTPPPDQPAADRPPPDVPGPADADVPAMEDADVPAMEDADVPAMEDADVPAPKDVVMDGTSMDVSMDAEMDAPGPDVVVEDVIPDVPDAPDGPMVECRTSADCATSMGGPVCDTATNRCVACTAAEDVCPVGNYCNAMNRCVPGCRSPMDCMGGMRCDTTTRMCVGCLADGDCALGTVCRMGTCVPGCGPGRGCGAGATCCGTMCVNTQSDVMNCGACGTACSMGQSCCAGRCVNTQTDTNNCGMCGTTCMVANATAACRAGACGVGMCNANFADCDMNAANGCEVDTRTSAANCGRCGNACPAAPNATGACTAGTCGIACNTGFANCDGNAANGCEVDTRSSATNCGRCGNACPAVPNAVPTCTAGACSFTCMPGFGNCDGNAANGCETNLNTTANNCGSCGRVCNLPNATAACMAGTCTIATCNRNFGNCDGNPANGCELPLAADRNNCGACGNRCSAMAICFDGACRDVCTAPAIICGSACINPQTDNANCGRCGNACVARANATNTCQMGACTLTCNRGFGNCDMMEANGCEVNLTSDTANCGACGNRCNLPNATPACRNGVCAIGSCNAGFADCDGNPANGCERPISADVNNCGACGRVCSFANAAATCAAGTCMLGACNMGFANCDGNAANGCEVNINANSLNCGACRRACPAAQACLNGTCVTSCPVGTTFCAGACVNVQTDNTNCGVCGRVCAAGTTCQMGTCRAVPPANDTIAGATPINLSTPSTTFRADTTNATNNVPTPCLGAGSNNGRDVFFRFTLTRREFVYADTAGSSYDTVLFLTNAMGVPITTQTSGDQVCNDDSGTCLGGSGLFSRVYTVLNPGDYLLAVSGFGTSVGTATIQFEHVPVGSGTLSPLAAGMSTLSGVTNASTPGTVTSATCGGAGPENTYWWVTCPGTGTSMPFTAETCGTASFDTVLYLNTGSGFTACNDDACGVQSRLSASYSLATRLHAFYVDGFASNSAGTYTVRVSRP
jgi:hypothetical protein